MGRTGHERLIGDIFRNADFRLFYTNEIKRFKEENSTPDIDFIAEDKEFKILILVQCKAKRRPGYLNLREVILPWKSTIKELQEKQKEFGVKEVKILFALKNITNAKEWSEYLKNKKDMFVWEDELTDYYKKLASTTKKASKFQLLKDLKYKFDDKGEIKVKAIRIMQQKFGKMVYLFNLHPTEIMRIGYVSRATPSHYEAYQRVLRKNRLKSLKAYLERENVVLPNAIIMSFPYSLSDRFETGEQGKEGDVQTGTLSLKSEPCSAFILDGQHRVYGFLDTRYTQKPQDNKFNLIISAFDQFGYKADALLFLEINDTQKRVDSSLRAYLYTICGPKKEPLTIAAKIGLALNKDRGVWHNKIKMFEYHRKRLVSLTSFSRYKLAELVDKDGALSGYEFEEQVGIVKGFFSSVHSAVGDNVWLNQKVYALTKPTGVNALFYLLEALLEKGKTKSEMKKIVKKLGKMNFTRDNVSSYGGGWKGFERMGRNMIKVCGLERK